MPAPDTLSQIAALVGQGDGQDRAFADALIRMGWTRTSDEGERAELEALHRALRMAALRGHAVLRAKIASGASSGAALRKHFDDIPIFERDHYVEEVLGIAYPPLEESELGPELLPYAASGYDEIVHALDVTGLGPGDRFLDIGSGTGKAVMLAAVLTGATSSGIERSAPLDEIARTAARYLGLVTTRFTRGDARDVPLEDADVVFMYLPFTGTVLASVLARLTEQAGRLTRDRFLCCGSLDLRRHPGLVPAGPPRSWLHVHRWR